MSCESPLKFGQWKTFSEHYKPIRVWLWFVYKITENNRRLRLFIEFIQTQKTWKSKTRVTSYEFKFVSYEFKSMGYEFKSTCYKTESTSCKIKSTSWDTKSTSQIVNTRVKRKDSEFKNIEFHDFTVSNETILATKQEFFFRKVAPVQSITDIALLRLWLILLPGMFISSYTIIYFYVNNFFFKCLYFSEYDIRMFLFVFWSRNRSYINYVRN